jgi:hypothetical protein
LSEGDEAARLLLYIRVVVYIFGNIVLSLDSPHQERMMFTAVISGVRSDRSPRKPVNIGESRRLSSYSTENCCKLRRALHLLLYFVLTGSVSAQAQSGKNANVFDPVRFLVGDWVGEG